MQVFNLESLLFVLFSQAEDKKEGESREDQVTMETIKAHTQEVTAVDSKSSNARCRSCQVSHRFERKRQLNFAYFG